MDSTLNPIANGNGSGIGQRLIGLQPPLSPPPAAAAVATAARPAAAPAVPAPAPVATAQQAWGGFREAGRWLNVRHHVRSMLRLPVAK